MSESRYGPSRSDRLDRWVSAGRQLVDGVSGARPGSRSRSGSRLRLDDLGRWVEDKLDWLLEEDEDWREPWQEQPLAARPAVTAEQRRARREPLQAISRRSVGVASGSVQPAGWPANSPANSSAPSQANDPGEWPDDDSFSVSRWRREPEPSREPRPPQPLSQPQQAGRSLPRSTRRRFD